MRDRQAIRRFSWVAAGLWMGVIFSLSAIPGDSMPAGQYGWFGHFSVYLVLGALYFVALDGRERGWSGVVLAVLLAAVYGATDEFHQSFVPGRMPDIADVMMDTAGALTGALLALGITRRRTRREPAPGDVDDA